VTHGEVRRLIEQVNDTQPYSPPEWCCDGVHCAGNDIRYAGMWERMNAVCQQFNFYGKVNPQDEWLENEFYSLNELNICSSLPNRHTFILPDYTPTLYQDQYHSYPRGGGTDHRFAGVVKYIALKL
jgi:hypothetical protein